MLCYSDSLVTARHPDPALHLNVMRVLEKNTYASVEKFEHDYRLELKRQAREHCTEAYATTGHAAAHDH